MEKYKIGQLSKSMGVSTHLLKHYEKFNLVYPTKDDSTNYRYYDLAQCTRIIESKKFRNMGFPLKDTACILNEMSTEDIDSLIASQVKELEQQIARLETQKFLAMKYYEESMALENCLNQWFVVEMDEFRYFEQTNNRTLIEGKELVQFPENMLDYAPVVKSYVQIEKESFLGDEPVYHWGVGFWTSDMEQIEHQNIVVEKLDYLPKGRAYVTYLKVEVPYMDNGRLIRAIREKYDEFEGNLTKDAFAVLMKTGTEQETHYHYYAVYIRL